jgi:hypothetical protein
MQPDDLIRVLTAQLVPEQLGEQLVIPVGAPPWSHRGDEAVGPLQTGQHRLAAVAAGEGVGQVAVQLVDDAGPQQEAAHLVGLPIQHLPGQVVGDALVVTGELGHEPVWVRLLLHGHDREPKPSGPSLGAGLQQGQVVLGQLRLVVAG